MAKATAQSENKSSTISDRALELLMLEFSELRRNQTVAANGWRLVLAIQFAVSCLLCVEIRSPAFAILATAAIVASAFLVYRYNRALETLSTKYKDQLLDNLDKSDMDSFLQAEYDRKLWRKSKKYGSLGWEPFWIAATATLTIWLVFWLPGYQDAASKADWQEYVVYSIIDRRFTENEYESGVTFDEIRSDYLNELATVKEVGLPKENITPKTLQKILMNLIRDQLVYKTHDDKYAVNRSELLPGFGRLSQQERAGIDILFVLSTEKGKYDDDSLQTRIIEKFRLSPQEYRRLITQMMKDNYVVRDEQGKLYSASDPPGSDGS